MISLISTVLNEGSSIQRLMETIQHQTRPPDEVIIVDGGSTDETVAVLKRYEDQLPLRIIVQPGCGISQGRNAALKVVTGDIVAITDAGVRLENDWLERLTQPLLEDDSAEVACGFFKADPRNTFEAALGAATLPLVNEINPETFLPSSRSVAVRKTVIDRVGGYPEWLDYCEDLIFDLRLKLSGARFVFVPGAVAHFQPRPTLRAFYKQYYLYARGDGKADLWRKRHLIRYATYFLALPVILLLVLAVHPICLLLLAGGGAVYLYQPYRRLPVIMQGMTRRAAADWLLAWLLIPVIRVTGDVAKMVGYPAGWLWRWQHHPPNWKQI